MNPPDLGAVYAVELLFEATPNASDPRLLEALRAARPGADVRGEQPTVVFHKDLPQKDGLPPHTVIAPSDKPLDLASLEPSLRQTWNWPAARATVARAKARLLVTDMMARWTPHAERLRIFQQTLLAVVRALRPIAIHWVPAAKLVDPAAFEAAMSGNDDERIAVGLNVRLFNIEGGGDDMVMDSMGLAFLYLPDLQVHFQKLDPTAVAQHLYNVALYVFQKGDVVQDGHTIPGLSPDQKWKCQHEASLLDPKRVVLDLNPGPPFAAGNRES
jgi:hypothetical protein